MNNCRTTRAAFSAFLAVGCASFSSLASAQPTQVTGKFFSHQVARIGQGGEEDHLYLGTGPGVVPINLSNGAGTFAGTLMLNFPDQTPPGHLDDAGTTVLLDSPMTTHVSFDMTWTTPTQKPGDASNIFSASIDAYTYALPGEDYSHPHCGIGPLVAPLQTGLLANTAYHFSSSADCTWTSLPFTSRLSFVISFTNFVYHGNSVALPDGFDVSINEYIVSTYTFSTADLSVDHIEVVQTVQDESNSIPLIAEKPAVARVFVKYEDTSPNPVFPQVTALLHGFHGTTELPGSPLSPFNPDGTVKAVFVFFRDFTNDALNFLLPDVWLEQGDLVLKAEVNPHRTVPEADYDNNTKSVTVTLRSSPVFLVDYLPVCYQDLQHCPSNAIAALDAMARKLFPLGDVDFLYRTLKTPRWVWPGTLLNGDDDSLLLAFLRRRYALTDSEEGVLPDQLVAWLPELNNGFDLGKSDPKWLGSTGRVSYDQDDARKDAAGTPADFRDAAHSFAHEIAHNLGLRHTDKAAAVLGDEGACLDSPGCCAIDARTDFPYADATIHEVGFDVLNKVAVRADKKDLMSYCTPPGSNIWISPFDYKKLIAGGLKPQARRAALSSSAPSDYVIVTGSANRDGKGGKIASMDHLTAFAGTEASDPDGNHCLQFSNSSSTALLNHCFTLTFEAENHGGAGVHLTTEGFSIKAPFPAGATKISLVTGSTQLASVTQSAHAPTISITSPSSGTVWSGVNTISWTASDGDGDPLTYSVLTSADNGSTWLPMETDLTASRFSFDTAELSAGSKTLFKVLASDGFNTTAATIGPLTILAQPFIEATPTLDFGTLASGQSSTLTILLTNRGELDVRVTALTLDNARFSTDATVPFSIAPGGSQSVNISFNPTSVGLKTARLTIVSDDAARSPLTVTLSGAGCVSVSSRPCASPRTPRVLPPR